MQNILVKFRGVDITLRSDQSKGVKYSFASCLPVLFWHLFRWIGWRGWWWWYRAGYGLADLQCVDRFLNCVVVEHAILILMESQLVNRIVYWKIGQTLNVLGDFLQPLRLAEQVGRAYVVLKAGTSKGRHLDALHLVALMIEVVPKTLSALKHLRQLLGSVYRFHDSLACGIRRIRHTETAWRAPRIIPDMLPYHVTPLNDVVAPVTRVAILVPFTIEGSYRYAVYTVSDPGRLDTTVELPVRIASILFPSFLTELVSQPRVYMILRAVRRHLNILRHGLRCLAIEYERTMIV